MMNETAIYKQQQKLSFGQFLAEIPNFIALSISVFFTGSLIVWMDFIDSLGNILRTGTVSILTKWLSKDLRYAYNYGVAKLEDIAVLFCDGIVMCGLIMAACLSVHELLDPRRPSDLLIFVAGLKIINVILDSIFLRGQYKLRKIDSGILTQSSYTAALGMLLFDVLELCSVFLVWALKDYVWSWCFTPIVSILIAVYLGYRCIGRLKNAISELTDKTLSEEDQMKILKVMMRHYDEYSEFHFVKSHKLRDKAQIDLVVSFSPETTYKEMLVLKSALQDEISEQIAGSTINITIV